MNKALEEQAQRNPVIVDEPPSPEPEPDPPPAGPPVALTQEQFTQLLQAIRGGGSAFTPDAFAEVMRQAREPIPENKIHHKKSAYNPLGDTDHPRPDLRLDAWIGTVGPDGQVAPAVQYIPELMTREEIEAINRLKPSKGDVTFVTGLKTACQVVEQLDASGRPFRLVVAFDQGFLKDRDKYNAIGPIPAMVTALNKRAA